MLRNRLLPHLKLVRNQQFLRLQLKLGLKLRHHHLVNLLRLKLVQNQLHLLR